MYKHINTHLLCIEAAEQKNVFKTLGGEQSVFVQNHSKICHLRRYAEGKVDFPYFSSDRANSSPRASRRPLLFSKLGDVAPSDCVGPFLFVPSQDPNFQ